VGIVNRIAQTEFVRTSIEEKADLSAFKGRPTARTISGLMLMGFSYIIAWPAIGVLGIVSVHFRKPSLIVFGGPVLYGLSHLVFTAGMWLTGAEYARAFLRWATRVVVERWVHPDDCTKSLPPEERAPFKGKQDRSP
jgi:hypothetical protein